jgi:ABC-type uncharacterized transport system permease subunit
MTCDGALITGAYVSARTVIAAVPWIPLAVATTVADPAALAA